MLDELAAAACAALADGSGPRPSRRSARAVERYGSARDRVAAAASSRRELDRMVRRHELRLGGIRPRHARAGARARPDRPGGPGPPLTAGRRRSARRRALQDSGVVPVPRPRRPETLVALIAGLVVLLGRRGARGRAGGDRARRPRARGRHRSRGSTWRGSRPTRPCGRSARAATPPGGTVEIALDGAARLPPGRAGGRARPGAAGAPGGGRGDRAVVAVAPRPGEVGLERSRDVPLAFRATPARARAEAAAVAAAVDSRRGGDRRRGRRAHRRGARARRPRRQPDRSWRGASPGCPARRGAGDGGRPAGHRRGGRGRPHRGRPHRAARRHRARRGPAGDRSTARPSLKALRFTPGAGRRVRPRRPDPRRGRHAGLLARAARARARRASPSRATR